jgi:integrase
MGVMVPENASAELKEAVAWLLSEENAGTSKAKQVYKRQFKEFCERKGYQFFPASPAVVALFMKECLLERNLAASTVSKAVPAAIADDYRFAGIPSPTASPLVKAAKDVAVKKGKAAKGKLPLQPSQLKEVLASLLGPRASFLDVRDAMVFVLLYLAMLRASNVAMLRREDVWVETDVESKEEVLFIFVSKAKNDQERKGNTVVLAAAGAAQYCPVALFRRYQLLRKQGQEFFIHQHVSGGMAASTINSIFKHRLSAACPGLDVSRYGSHSGRKGGATAAAAKEIEERLIKRHGGWKSDAVHVYIWEAMPNRLAVSKGIYSRLARGIGHGIL